MVKRGFPQVWYGWFARVSGRLEGHKQDDIHISVEDLKKQMKFMLKWKGPGPDGIHEYWLWSFTGIHERFAVSLDDCIRLCQIPKWLVVERTIFIMKDPAKRPDVENSRPIAYLNLLWKTLTGIISSKVYDHLEINC